MRDKQIEEMEKIIQLILDNCWAKDFFPNSDEIAENLYNAGYRKKSDVAREIIRILRAAGINKYRYPVIAEIEKKYESEGEG